MSHRVGPLKSACSTWMVQGCKMQLPAAARFSIECTRANLRCSLPLQYHITFYPIILSSCRLCTVAWSPSLSARSTVEHSLINRSRKSPGGQDALVRQTAEVASHRIGPSTSTTDGGGWVRWTPVQTPKPGHGRSWQGPGDPLYHYERGAVAQTSSTAVATQQCFVSHTSHRAGETGLTAEFDLAPVCSANPGQSWQIEQPLPVL